jgi:hypothetical protein
MRWPLVITRAPAPATTDGRTVATCRWSKGGGEEGGGGGAAEACRLSSVDLFVDVARSHRSGARRGGRGSCPGHMTQLPLARCHCQPSPGPSDIYHALRHLHVSCARPLWPASAIHMLGCHTTTKVRHVQPPPLHVPATATGSNRLAPRGEGSCRGHPPRCLRKPLAQSPHRPLKTASAGGARFLDRHPSHPSRRRGGGGGRHSQAKKT